MKLFLLFIGIPLLGAIITMIMGLVASAPGCFLLTMGFCLMAALTLPFSLKLIERSNS